MAFRYFITFDILLGELQFDAVTSHHLNGRIACVRPRRAKLWQTICISFFEKHRHMGLAYNMLAANGRQLRLPSRQKYTRFLEGHPEKSKLTQKYPAHTWVFNGKVWMNGDNEHHLRYLLVVISDRANTFEINPWKCIDTQCVSVCGKCG